MSSLSLRNQQGSVKGDSAIPGVSEAAQDPPELGFQGYSALAGARFPQGKTGVHSTPSLNLGSLPLAETPATPTGLPWQWSSMCLLSMETRIYFYFLFSFIVPCARHYLLPSKYFLLDCFLGFQNTFSPAFWPSPFLYSFTTMKSKPFMVLILDFRPVA